MGLKEYRTAAALFTVARQRLGDPAPPQLVATLLCKRAECLLQMVSIVVSCLKTYLRDFPLYISCLQNTCYYSKFDFQLQMLNKSTPDVEIDSKIAPA